MSKKKILIIDDEDPFRYVLKFNLEQKGYQAIEARSGEAGLELALREVPDLILLDGKMPEMSGPETFKQLRSKEETKKIPVIFISGRSQQDHELDSILHEADGYIEKPCKLDELDAKMVRIIGS